MRRRKGERRNPFSHTFEEVLALYIAINAAVSFVRMKKKAAASVASSGGSEMQKTLRRDILYSDSKKSEFMDIKDYSTPSIFPKWLSII